MLTRCQPASDWPTLASLRPAWERIEPSSVVLVISDGFDATSAAFALQLSATQRDVRSIALTSVDERDFAMRGAFEFIDPETGTRIEADAPAARADFRKRFASARRALSLQLTAGGVRHIEHMLDQSLADSLRVALDGRPANRSRER